MTPRKQPQWPRLSETLQHRGRFDACQSCEAEGPLRVWQEADDGDRFEACFVIICRRCSDLLIESHPRLYRLLSANAPAPGVMAICSGCAHRQGSRCTSPMLRSLGGPGLAFRAPDVTMHICSQDESGRRCCRRAQTWYEPVSTCPGREWVLPDKWRTSVSWYPSEPAGPDVIVPVANRPVS